MTHVHGGIKMNNISHSGVSKLKGAKIGSGRYPLGSGKRPYQDYPDKQKTDTKNSEESKSI